MHARQYFLKWANVQWHLDIKGEKKNHFIVWCLTTQLINNSTPLFFPNIFHEWAPCWLDKSINIMIRKKWISVFISNCMIVNLLYSTSEWVYDWDMPMIHLKWPKHNPSYIDDQAEGVEAWAEQQNSSHIRHKILFSHIRWLSPTFDWTQKLFSSVFEQSCLWQRQQEFSWRKRNSGFIP